MKYILVNVVKFHRYFFISTNLKCLIQNNLSSIDLSGKEDFLKNIKEIDDLELKDENNGIVSDNKFMNTKK